MNIIAKINSAILNPLIILMFALAVVYFSWGLAEFIRGQDSEDAIAKGKQHMLWGVIGVFIMMSVWGILGLIQKTVDSIK